MNLKPIFFRQRAEWDIEGTFDYYLTEAGEKVAVGFSAALDRALRQIERHPAAGSPRYAHELNVPGLRFWPLGRYPLLIFYVEREVMIEIWRVLHAERDIPAHMRDDPDG